MQPIKQLASWLEENANQDHALFSLQDFRSLFPRLSYTAFKTLMSRAVDAEILTRICRGIYTHKNVAASGLLLFHTAALLRVNEFNYISLETVLSDQGIISQVPMNWISIMSSGRSHIVHCGKFGTIEFIHTNQKQTDLLAELTYDAESHLWRASVKQALRDMKKTRRNCDLIDWDLANEFI